KRPSRLHCSMIGTRFSSMKRRVVERTRRSSSESRESNSMKSTPLNLKTGITPLPFQNWVSAGWARCRKSTPAQGKPYKLAEERGRVKPAGLRIRSRRCLVRRTPVWLHVLSEKSEDVLPPDINTVEEESVPGGPGIIKSSILERGVDNDLGRAAVGPRLGANAAHVVRGGIILRRHAYHGRGDLLG